MGGECRHFLPQVNIPRERRNRLSFRMQPARLLAVILTALISVSLLFSIFDQNTITANAKQEELKVSALWKNKKNTLTWSDNSSTVYFNETISSGMWQDTSSTSVYWVNVTAVDNTTSYSSAKESTFGLDWDEVEEEETVEETPAAEEETNTETIEEPQPSESTVAEEEQTEENTEAEPSPEATEITEVTVDSEELSQYTLPNETTDTTETDTEEVSDDSDTLDEETTIQKVIRRASSTSGNGVKVIWNKPSTNSVGREIVASNESDLTSIPVSTNRAVIDETNEYQVIASSTVDTVQAKAYTGTDTDADLYYTVDYDSTLKGYYRTYYVSTADQLHKILSVNNSSYIKADSSELPDISGNTKAVANKVAIRLISDIDLCGGNSKYWSNVSWSNKGILDFNGCGHTIYNGYFTGSNCFIQIGNNNAGFLMRNVTFSNMYLTKNRGMFGNKARYVYFYNVDFTKCIAETTTDCTTLILGIEYEYCYFKECTISESYIYSSNSGHCAFFGSYDSLEFSNSLNPNGTYYTEIPTSLSAVESLWNSSNRSYPTIFEDCQVIDSEVYYGNVNSNHQGVFISCTQGGEIFRRCFCNGSAYGSQQIGVFIGACIGSGNGFYMDINNEKVLVNTYFEDCFTSGSVEGSTKIGGFIGMLYDDYRANSSNSRGICYFKDCYSTSSVGMQYSGSYVGGFAGLVAGNYGTGTGTVTGSNISHRFINCYAAGEVGGIATDVSTDETNTKSIGGFFGGYFTGTYIKNNQYYYLIDDNNSVTGAPDCTNCYYDKQTTAMRERDIGGANLTASDSKSNGISIGYQFQNNTLKGLQGIYTKASSTKNVNGLTDTDINTLFSSDNSYVRVTDYYPQIGSILNAEVSSVVQDLDSVSVTDTSGNNVCTADTMLSARETLKHDYSMASTAAVFLDHYDEILNESGEKVTAETTVYDTVRDITRKFTFTSKDSSGNASTIKWAVDSDLNTSHGFAENMGGNNGFTVTYSSEDIESSSYTKTVNAKVLNIAYIGGDSTNYTGGEFRCVDFAPGKNWVTVTYENGQRHLRLLPTAYLNAGNIMTINVGRDENGNAKNTINAKFGANDTITLTKFNHSIGVVYAITDKNRMADTTIYGGQSISSYTSQDKTSFALYGKYLVKNTSTEVGTMQEQAFSTEGTINGMTNTNNSSSGKTIVRIYKTTSGTESDPESTVDENGNTITSTTYVIEPDYKQEVTGDDLKKWSGKELFTNNDTGYYYMVYQWRLNDGRYLEDMKLVQVSKDNYSLTLATGVMNEENSYSDNAGCNDVDLYVTDGIGTGDSATKVKNALDQSPNVKYPTKNSNFNDETIKEEYAQTGDFSYNTAKVYGGDTYYMKSDSIISNSSVSAVQWLRTTDYKLTTLIIQARDDSGEWHDLQRTDDVEDVNKFDFTGATYSYNLTRYEASQDVETKLFTMKKTIGDTRNVEVTTAGDVSNGIQRNIIFNFDTSGTAMATVNDDIRVIALFRKNKAEVAGEKYVLTGDLPSSSIVDNETTETTYDSIADMDSVNEVDDTDIEEIASRKAVMPGTKLTYRVKLTNNGFMESDQVDAYDDIPEGTTYVPNSMKIYRQTKDLASGSITFNKPELIAYLDENGTCQINTALTDYRDLTKSISMLYLTDDKITYPDHNLTWTLPGISMETDYYVEYQVTVDSYSDSNLDGMKPSELRKLLTNTATWDYIALNGETMKDGEDYDMNIQDYKENAIFEMTVKVSQNENKKEIENRQYSVTFKQKGSEQYDNITFTNSFPSAGFTLSEGTGMISLIRVSDGETIVTGVLDQNGNFSSSNTSTNDKEKNIAISISKDNTGKYTSFTISGLNLSEGDEYKVVFSGTQQKLGTSDITQITNRSEITYQKTSTTTTGTTETTQYGNSVEKTEVITNQVETDVTWHYINIEKQIDVNDPSQSFLIKISYYGDDSSLITPSSVWYTKVNCTNAVKDENDNITGYTGNTYFELPMTGWYTVEEVTDWSQTDYGGDCTASYTDAKKTTSTSAQTHSSTSSVVKIYVTNSNADTSSADITLSSAAYPTSQGTDPTWFAKASFKNEKGEYAYRSAQAYQDNVITLEEGGTQ